MPKTRDATQILDQMTGDDEEMQQLIAEETLNAEVARLIYEARTVVGLTQAELAERIGTKQTSDRTLGRCRLRRHSLSMLQRIALALNQRIELHFVPLEKTSEAA